MGGGGAKGGARREDVDDEQGNEELGNGFHDVSHVNL